MSPLAFTSGESALVQLPASGGARMAGAQGEKATPVYFDKLIEIEDKTADRGRETGCIPMLRTFNSFMLRKLMASLPCTPNCDEVGA